MNKEKELARQTVRMDKDFYKELKKILIEKDVSYQKLVENYLHEWYEKNK